MHASFKPDETDKLTVLHNCLTAIKEITNNTEVLIIASDSIHSKAGRCIVSLPSVVQSNLRNLCVIYDQALYFDQHIKSLTHACFFHLRNIAKLSSVGLSQPEPEISSQLDYCNCFFTCLSKSSLDRLQMVQNAAVDQVQQDDSHHTHLTFFT